MEAGGMTAPKNIFSKCDLSSQAFDRTTSPVFYSSPILTFFLDLFACVAPMPASQEAPLQDETNSPSTNNIEFQAAF